MSVKSVDEHRLLRPHLTYYQEDDRPPLVITAEQAELHTDLEKDALLITLTNPEMERGSTLHMSFPDTLTIEVPLTTATGKQGNRTRPADTPLRDIPAAIERQKADLQQLQQTFAADAAFELISGDFQSLNDVSWQHRQMQLVGLRSTLHRLHTEPWRRWANGFSCLAFVMVGVPLAIRLRTADVWSSFGLCFLPILIGYYPLLAYGVDLSKSGDLPPYSVWIGNVVLFAVGYLMIRRTLRR